jgi:hypothetical protein
MKKKLTAEAFLVLDFGRRRRSYCCKCNGFGKGYRPFPLKPTNQLLILLPSVPCLPIRLVKRDYKVGILSLGGQATLEMAVKGRRV